LANLVQVFCGALVLPLGFELYKLGLHLLSLLFHAREAVFDFFSTVLAPRAIFFAFFHGARKF